MTKNIFRQLTALSLFFAAVPAVAQSLPAYGTAEPIFTSEEVAASQKDPGQFIFDPDSVEMTARRLQPYEMGEGYLAVPRLIPEGKENPIVVIDEIVNIGLKIWDFIKENEPVVDIDTQYATALPKGIEHWQQLSGWQGPDGWECSWSAKSFVGLKIIDIKFLVLYTYSGAYDGKGKYLTGVTVKPTKVWVAWGNKVSLTAKVDDSTIVNVAPTSEDPEAAMQLMISIHAHSVIADGTFGTGFYIKGDGTGYQLTGRNTPAVEVKDIRSAAPLLGDQTGIFK